MLKYEVNMIKENLEKHEECEQLAEMNGVRDTKKESRTQSTRKPHTIHMHTHITDLLINANSDFQANNVKSNTSFDV